MVATYARRCQLLFTLVVYLQLQAEGQISIFPHAETFDSVPDSALPAGWSSTRNRLPGTNDFLTLSITPHSPPKAVGSANATIEQILTSPLFDFFGFIPERIQFFTRRSATHLAAVVVEASLDSGQTFPLQVGDTLLNTSPNNYVFHSFMIPTSLADQPAVKFRWRVVPDVSGATGTFRLDDVTVSVILQHDLAVDSVFFLPQSASEFDSVSAIAVVRNLGQQVADLFSVKVYDDRNRDSIPQVEELIGSSPNLSPLSVADSVNVAALIGRFAPGNVSTIVQVEYAQDQNLINNRRYSELHVGYEQASVIVNEIMYAPTGTEPEWVELYNARADSISLQGWLISDNIVTSKRLITALPIGIPPAGYVVLTRDSAAILDVHPDIPSRVLPVTGFPTLNNTGDAVVLYDDRGETMDSTTYMPSWGGNSGGYSLERIDPRGPSAEAANWRTSRSPHRSTPGVRNSVSRKDFDLSVDTVLLSPSNPLHGDSIVATIKVRNIGFHPAPSYIIQLFNDSNNDSIPQPTELVRSASLSLLAPLDSLLFSFQPFWPRSNEQQCIAEVHFVSDEDSLNNRGYARKVVGYRGGTVVINEIMYNPVGEPEWVEFFNTTGATVDLAEWKVSNRLSSHYTMADTTTALSPFGYAVITKDTALMANRYGLLPGTVLQVSSLPTFLFNNGGDAVAVFDNQGRQIDSVRYSPSWGGNGIGSLERIDVQGSSTDSLNWSSSADSLGATPGKENSVAALDQDLRLLRSVTVTVPPGTAVQLRVTVKNIGRFTSGPFDIVFYDDVNNDSVAVAEELILRVHVSQSLPRGDTMAVVGQWLNASPGVHAIIARLEYPPDLREANNSTVFNVKIGYDAGIVAVNEIMFDPFDGEAEYVELVNCGGSSIDLSGWMISDRPSENGIANQFALSGTRQPLYGEEFVVIASDSSVFSRFPYLDTLRVMVVVNKGTLGLNNDGDAVVVTDATGNVIDSVSYVPGWHNPSVTDRRGRSLERIRPGLASNDRRSWSTCALGIGGTPGLKNSIYAMTLSQPVNVSCSPNPFSPDGDGFEDFSVVHYSLPVDVTTVSVRIYDVLGRLIRHLVNNEPGGVTRDVVWDGRDDDKRKARVGIYVVLVVGSNESGGDIYSAKGVVVLAARM